MRIKFENEEALLRTLNKTMHKEEAKRFLENLRTEQLLLWMERNNRRMRAITAELPSHSSASPRWWTLQNEFTKLMKENERLSKKLHE